MAKAQGKKTAAAGSKGAAKKVAAQVKKAVKAVAKKTVPSKKAAPKPAAKKAVPAKPAPKPAPKAARPAPKPAPKAVAKPAAKPPAKPAPKTSPKASAKAVAKAATKPVKKAAEKVKKAAANVVKKVVAAAKAAPAAGNNKGKAAPAIASKNAPASKPATLLSPVAVPPVTPSAPVAPTAPEPEKKRGRRARTRITSSGAPAAAWLSTEKPRPASFIPAPPRAEAPSAIAAPPASSDRLLRPEDVINLIAVRTVPVRVDIEQGAGRFYVIAYPQEVTVKVGEGIEWDFRYVGGADVTADEVVIEFERPAPFPQIVYRTRKPGGARPHRQLSGGAIDTAAGKRVQYTIRAMNMFKTEMASTRVWVNVTG